MNNRLKPLYALAYNARTTENEGYPVVTFKHNFFYAQRLGSAYRFLKIGASMIGRTKAGNRANKASRSFSVVESMRHLFSCGALLLNQLRSIAI